MSKSNFDIQLEKALHLMEYERKPIQESRTNVQFYKMGADDKVYGIIREGASFVIKTTEPGKEKISESYSYIGGVNNAKANTYRDYNMATKQLELKLMSLNEAYGKKLATNTIDYDKSEKVLSNLTEEARAAINRANQIFENSFISKDNIGNHGNPESKGTSTGANTTKNNAPFEDKAEAKLDKDIKANGTVKGATPDNKEVAKGVESDLQSDKMKTANSGSEKDYKDAHDDLDGEGVADKKPAGGKVVRVNEGIFDDETIESPEEIDIDGLTDETPEVEDVDDVPVDDIDSTPELETDDTLDASLEDDSLVGFDDDSDLETMIREFEEQFATDAEEPVLESDSVITGPNKVLDGPHGTDGKDAEWERVDESFIDDEDDESCEGGVCKGNEETMKSYQSKGSLPVQTWDKMNESLESIVDDVYRRLCEGQKPKKKLTLQERINRIVKEEVTKLDAWGKHPRYQKPAFTTPANKEVLAGTADRDFNDDSAKGEAPYGKKVGSSAPYDKLVNMLTDSVLNTIKKSK